MIFIRLARSLIMRRRSANWRRLGVDGLAGIAAGDHLWQARYSALACMDR